MTIDFNNKSRKKLNNISNFYRLNRSMETCLFTFHSPPKSITSRFFHLNLLKLHFNNGYMKHLAKPSMHLKCYCGGVWYYNHAKYRLPSLAGAPIATFCKYPGGAQWDRGGYSVLSRGDYSALGSSLIIYDIYLKITTSNITCCV